MFNKDITTIKKCTIGTMTLYNRAMFVQTVKLNLKKGRYLWRMNNSPSQDRGLKETVKKQTKK